MPDSDREHWNRRYSAGEGESRPSEWLVGHLALIQPRQPNPRALDLACGRGENSLYLAQFGFHVDGWDISDVALDLLRSQLGEQGESLDVAVRQVDLVSSTLPAATYDVVLDINFLERQLFRGMAAALRQDGLLLMRALMQKADGEDRNPAYLLEPGELRRAFPELQTLEYAEDPVAAISTHSPTRPMWLHATADTAAMPQLCAFVTAMAIGGLGCHCRSSHARLSPGPAAGMQLRIGNG